MVTFKVLNTIFKGYRKPNDKEAKSWFYGTLRFLHFQYSDKINTVQYRTLKGMVNKGNLVPVFNFLDKRGFDDIKLHYQKYRAQETMAMFDTIVKFNEPIKTCTLDISLEPSHTTTS